MKIAAGNVELCANSYNICKIKNRKERLANRADWGSPLQRQSFALYCSAIEEERRKKKKKKKR
jgi:hypothetical protein